MYSYFLILKFTSGIFHIYKLLYVIAAKAAQIQISDSLAERERGVCVCASKEGAEDEDGSHAGYH